MEISPSDLQAEITNKIELLTAIKNVKVGRLKESPCFYIDDIDNVDIYVIDMDTLPKLNDFTPDVWAEMFSKLIEEDSN